MAKIIPWILTLSWAALTLYLTTTPNLVVAPETWFNTILMNGAHFVFFGIQAVLLKLSMPMYGHRMTTALTVITTSAFGYYIEVLQKTIPGRSYDLFDWALDTLGAIIFVLLLSRTRKMTDSI